jgi:transcriptional regulator with XRE-family HTH domain
MQEDLIFKNLAQKITKLRKAKKLSVQEAAYNCDIDKANLIRIEKGRTHPTVKTLIKIAHGYEVEVKELFDF